MSRLSEIPMKEWNDDMLKFAKSIDKLTWKDNTHNIRIPFKLPKGVLYRIDSSELDWEPYVTYYKVVYTIPLRES